MNKETVQEQAQVHGDAVVSGDLRTAGSALTREAREQAGAVMEALPKTLTGAAIDSVEEAGDTVRARIRYSGESDDVVVESTWEERDGSPRIVGLKVV